MQDPSKQDFTCFVHFPIFKHMQIYVLYSIAQCRTLQTQWTVASQAPLSMGLSWQEYWTGLPSPSPGDLPDPGTERVSSVAPALAGRFFTTELPGKALYVHIYT